MWTPGSVLFGTKSLKSGVCVCYLQQYNVTPLPPTPNWNRATHPKKDWRKKKVVNLGLKPLCQKVTYSKCVWWELHCFQCRTLLKFSSPGRDWWRNVMHVNCGPSTCSIGCLQQLQDVYMWTLLSEKMQNVASLNWSGISRKGLLVTSCYLAAQRVFTRGQMDYWPFFSLHLFPPALMQPFYLSLGDVVPGPFLSASLSLPVMNPVE